VKIRKSLFYSCITFALASTSAYAEKKDAESGSSPWFPDWDPGEFTVSIYPLVGFQSKTDKDAEGVTTTSSALEYGVSGAARNIGIVDANPGVELTPYIGVARTEMKTVSTADNFETISDSMTRMWGGIAPTFYAGWYRHVLDIGLGKSFYSDSERDDVNLLRVRNNMGVRVLSWFSLHYQPTYTKLYARTAADEYYYEWDHWAYFMTQSSFLDFRLRLGPGQSNLNLRDRTADPATRIKAEESYALADASFKLFWSLGAEASVKYVFKGEDSLNEALSEIQPPDRSIQERQGYFPDETLRYRVFVGQLTGFGLGVFYDSVSFKDPETSKRTTDDEWGISVRYQIDVAD
jgi:hypothetical protein